MYVPPDRLLDGDFWARASLADVEAELARGIDPNVIEEDALIPNTTTPLHLAASCAEPRLIAALVDHGADIEAREDFLNRTPIHFAASYNPNVNAVALLIERGAAIWARDQYGETILHAAAGHAQQMVVELLLDIGMSVGVTDNWGNTPLHKAAWNPGPETAALLIARGADKNAKTRHGYTPYQVGVEAVGRRLYGMDQDGYTSERAMNEELLRVLQPQ